MHCLLTLLPPIPLKHSGSVPGRLASRPACSSPVLRTGVTAILPHRRNEESRRSIAELTDAMSGIFQAVVEATEEVMVSSRHGTVQALPVDEVLAILRQHGALRR